MRRFRLSRRMRTELRHLRHVAWKGARRAGSAAWSLGKSTGRKAWTEWRSWRRWRREHPDGSGTGFPGSPSAPPLSAPADDTPMATS